MIPWLVNIPVHIGEILASRYRVEGVLGEGAMGVVVAARHVQLGSLFALKFMRADVIRVEGAADRFIREARAAARLRGEHVARVSDFGTLESGAPYIVMEFLEGSDLDALLETRGPLPIREALGYVLDACKAMDEAHRLGIVHRDLKPKNLFLTHRPDGTPLIKVLDFGISKFADGTDVGHTSTGSILGSPAFMSPEQIRSSKHVDARTDIYALGGVIYYLLTKDYPFTSNAIGELFASVLYKDPRPLRTLRNDVPSSLEAIIGRCLQKEPDARYPDVAALMRAIRSYMDWEDSGETEVIAQGALPAAVPPVPAPGVSLPLVSQAQTYPRTATSMAPATNMQSTLDHAISARGIASNKVKSLPMLALCLLSLAVICGAGFRILRTRHADAPSAASSANWPDTALGEAPAPSSSNEVPRSVGPVETPLAPLVPSPAASGSTDASQDVDVHALQDAASASQNSAARGSAGAHTPHTSGSSKDSGSTGAPTKPRTPAPAATLRHGALYDDGHSAPANH